MIRALATACLCAAALCPRPARACVRTTVPGAGPCLWWGDRTIPYRVNQAGTDDVTDGADLDAVQESFRAWTDIPCSDLEASFGGLTSRRDVGFDPLAPDNVNLLVWRERVCSAVAPASDDCWSCVTTGGTCCSTKFHCWEHPLGVIAVTTTWFSRTTGQLFDADIEFNGSTFWFTVIDTPQCNALDPDICDTQADCQNGYRCHNGFCTEEGCVHTDVGNTVTHEAGHLLGLDHAADAQATMFASAPAGELLKRTLESDDTQCICDIYPVGGATSTCLGGTIDIVPIKTIKNARGCGCASGSGTHAAWLLLLLAPILRRARLTGPGTTRDS